MKRETTSLRTKRALADGLKHLMRRKAFSKITVSELVAECGVNRKTFYYHFEDMHHLLHWTLDAEAMQVMRQLDLPMDYERAIRFVMEYVEQNEFFIRCACDAVGRDGMRQLFYADFIETISAALERAGSKGDEGFRQFAAGFYAEALAGVLLDWVKNRERRDREEVVAYLCQIIGRTLTLI